MTSSRRWRSVSGQLTLLAGVFAAALVLAGGLVLFRQTIFQPLIRLKFPPGDDWSEDAYDRLSSPATADDDLRRLDEDLKKRLARERDPSRAGVELDRLCGEWLNRSDDDAVLPRRLTAMQPDGVVVRLRRTLVAGSRTQRLRALRWMEYVVADDRVRDDVLDLARYTLKRAEARKEPDVLSLARDVLDAGDERRE